MLGYHAVCELILGTQEPPLSSHWNGACEHKCAWQEYTDDPRQQEISHRVAWAAVKRVYPKRGSERTTSDLDSDWPCGVDAFWVLLLARKASPRYGHAISIPFAHAVVRENLL
jgi:hypothetical protein